MRMHSPLIGFAAGFASLALAGAAQAGPDESGTAIIDEPNGIPGICDQPCYSVTKEYEVWLEGNPDSPDPLAGNNTYVYRLTHSGGTGTPLGIIPPLLGFELSVDTTQVTAAGYIGTSSGVTPDGTTIDAVNNVVSWDFTTSFLNPGEVSKLLTIHSPLLPGELTDTMVSVSGGFSLAAQGMCIGPFVEPMGQDCNLTVEKEGCVQQPPDPGGDACEGKVTAFTFEYTGLGCDASSHLQNPKKVMCIGGANGEEPVDIVVGGKKRKRWGRHWGWWGKKRHKKVVFASVNDVSVGDSITVDASAAGKHTLGSATYIKISQGNGWHDIIEIDKFHTSCSQPLAPGNQFGSALITSLTSTQGGTVDLEEDGEECATSIDVAPAPHCEGKIESLQLRYIGGDCGQTMHSQASGKVECWDSPAGPTADPVRIIISDGAAAPPATNVYVDVTGVVGGDIITVNASDAGHSRLKSVTGYWIKKANTGEVLQDGYWHTSCSQPLNLGDVIGALQVFGMDTTQGGTVALGASVDYTYTVTNPNDGQADNVEVLDDQIGVIVTGASIPAMTSVSYVATQIIEEATTNIATVTGDVAGTVCVGEDDSVTITLNEPPEEPTTCTKKIAAVLFKYTGPDIPGATVVFKAKSFMNDSVTYNIDLVNGMVLSMPSENGYTIDGTAHGETHLGSKMWVIINGVEETIHTSCSKPFTTNQPAPLHGGGTSTNWFVVDFAEKQHHHHHHCHH